MRKLIISLCILGIALTGCSGSELVAAKLSDVPSEIEDKVDLTRNLQLIYGKDRNQPYVIYQPESQQEVDYTVETTDDTYILKLTETSEQAPEDSLQVFQINTSDTDTISIYIKDVETAIDVLVP
ncbi:hypothetical protein ACI2JA_01210 [Alkalihalobacillus sp. NPDC078783]